MHGGCPLSLHPSLSLFLIVPLSHHSFSRPRHSLVANCLEAHTVISAFPIDTSLFNIAQSRASPVLAIQSHRAHHHHRVVLSSNQKERSEVLGIKMLLKITHKKNVHEQARCAHKSKHYL